MNGKINVGYIRVSTEKQVVTGHSLDYQRKVLEQYFIERNVMNYQIIADEGISAKSLIRTGIKSVMDMIENNQLESLVVTKFDRLTRSNADFQYLQFLTSNHNVRLISLTEDYNLNTADGKFVANIVINNNQFEREKTSERTKSGLIGKANKGEYPFKGAPFGFDKDSNHHLTPNDDARAIKHMYWLWGESKNVNRIASEMSSMLDKYITGKQVEQFLKKTIYRGYVVINDQKIDLVESLITEEKYQLYKNRHYTVKALTKRDYLFGNTIYINNVPAHKSTQLREVKKIIVLLIYSSITRLLMNMGIKFI